jgi:Glycosyl transferases group 1
LARGPAAALSEPGGKPDLVALSHLRWSFVYQRPQHLMSRFARERRVFFVEEPIWAGDGAVPRLETTDRPEGVTLAVPHLPAGLAVDAAAAEAAVADLLAAFLAERGSTGQVLWSWTPMALPWARDLSPAAVVYDCMDELSLFAGAPPELLAREERLLARADLVFTGGRSLFEAKRGRHPAVHLFPSSIDAAHFGRARTLSERSAAGSPEPADQAAIPRPRLGYFGVIDERLDRELLAGLAAARSDWQLVLIGPVVKVGPATLPRAANIHYLGMKPYEELPAYLAGWDVALLPFADNDATRFISPTKTPEYLAGGRRVVSTPIRDVVEPYGRLGLVEIGNDAAEFASAIERCLAAGERPEEAESWLKAVDEHLAGSSWDETWRRMSALVDAVTEARRRAMD